MKRLLLKESEIVKACREPSVIEIQEPAMIEKPGTLTRLNSLFDDGAVTDLVNGEQIRRNPDTIVIMTTNLDYVGCQNFNQSVLSPNESDSAKGSPDRRGNGKKGNEKNRV